MDGTNLFKETNVTPYDCTHAVLMRRHGLKEMISANAYFQKFGFVKRTGPFVTSDACQGAILNETGDLLVAISTNISD